MPFRTVGGTKVVDVCSTFPAVGKCASTESIGLVGTSIGFCMNVSLVGPWKRLRGDQMMQPLQPNRALDLFSEKPISFGLFILSLALWTNSCHPMRSFLLQPLIVSSIFVLGRVKAAACIMATCIFAVCIIPLQMDSPPGLYPL